MGAEEKNVATTTATSTTQRVITIVATRGEKVKIPFTGNSWEDLKKVLEKGGKDVEGNRFEAYGLSNMKCVESINKTTLEHPKAVVPEGNFNLFLMPYKSKSGGDLSRADCNAKIKEFIAADETKAKEHFNAGGKNYTNKSTPDLNSLIESYKPGTKKAVEKNKATAIAEVVHNVKTAKEAGNEEDLLANLSGLSDSEKLDVVIKLLLDLKINVGAGTAAPAAGEDKEQEVTKKEESPKKPEETPAEKEIRLKKEAKKREDDELEAEMGDLASGFNDVRL